MKSWWNVGWEESVVERSVMLWMTVLYCSRKTDLCEKGGRTRGDEEGERVGECFDLKDHLLEKSSLDGENSNRA